MVVAQKVKESEITEQDSLILTRNLLRIAIFNISYIRGLFPEKYFSDKSVPALDMKIKKLMPLDSESRRLVDWMEKGVYDALQKKYLKTLLFCVCETVDGPMIEEYTFSFSYSNSDSQDVSMNINRSGTKKGGKFKHDSSEITPSQMRSSACKMVRTLIQLMRTLDKMPKERTVLMKLLYYDDVTPMDYEPPFFRGCTEEEGLNTWTRSPLKMEIGNVNSKHLVLALKVKSVLDPFEDENNDSQDNEISLDADSLQKDDCESDSEISDSDNDQYVVTPEDTKRQSQEDDDAMDEGSDDTQDPAEGEHQLGCVKDWITSYPLEVFQITDVLSCFPAISEILLEEILDKLVKEGIISQAGDKSFGINKKKFDHEVDGEKEELDVHVIEKDAKAGNVEVDHTYMRALYHALPMNYITISKLQKKLDGEANLPTVRKLIDKMAQDGFVEAGTKNRRLGKRVIHSDLTKKKLVEVNKILGGDAMDLDGVESVKSKVSEAEIIDNIPKNSSTCGGLHSIGSDVTRTRGKSDTYMNNSTRSDQDVVMMKANGESTPTSMAKPAGSRESFVPRADGVRGNGSTNRDDDAIVSSTMSTQDKRFRKTSMVKEPILQSTKRQKCVAA